MRSSGVHRALGHLILVATATLAVAPLLAVLIMALGEPNTLDSSISVSGSLNFTNFKDVWELAGLGGALLTSLQISVSATLLTMLLAVPAGYALARFRFPFRGLFFLVLLAGLMLPNESLIIPLFYDFRHFGLTDSILGVVLVETSLGLAFGCFWMRSYFLTASTEIVEAGRMDGANSMTILRKLLLPMAVPQLLALAVLTFVWTWNDLLVPLVMFSGGQHVTAPMSLATFQGQYTSDYTYLAAAAILTALPVVVVYVVLQRSFALGISSGAVKG